MTGNPSVCVIIVTYNRKQLLTELMDDLLHQTYPIKGIVVVNNASTDGTEEKLAELGVIVQSAEGSTVESVWNDIKIYYYLSPINTGGSGGFAKAFEIVKDLPYDLVWAMDDDISPEKNCLEELISNIGPENGVCVPCRNDENWTDYIVTDYNLTNPFLVKLDTYKTRLNSETVRENRTRIVDMPLEGPLFQMEVIRKIGIPNKDYFILFDDTDYAYRASLITNILYIKSARLHRKLAKRQTKVNEWSWKAYYELRNQFYFDMQYGKNWMVRYFRPFFSSRMKLLSAILRRKKYRVRVLNKAYNDAKQGNMGMIVKPGTDIQKEF